jgi:hypothetical protein
VDNDVKRYQQMGPSVTLESNDDTGFFSDNDQDSVRLDEAGNNSDDNVADAHSQIFKQPAVDLEEIERSSEAPALAGLFSGAPIDRFTGRLDVELLDGLMDEQEPIISSVSGASVAPNGVSDIIIPTRVRVDEACDNIEWIPPCDRQLPPTELPSSPTLAEVSRHHHLNEKQHKAFTSVGKKLLSALVNGANTSEDQLVTFLGGLPGAGKSQVIKAIQALATAWHHPDAQATVAFQGVAAQAANGDTIHKLFGWGLHGPTKRWSPNERQRERFARLRLLIIDEVSTTDAKMIGMVDAALRLVLGHTDEFFGGIDVLFVGDWLQQLPVMGVPAFVDAPPCPQLRKQNSPMPRETSAYMMRVKGIEAYKRVNNIIILTENMRHKSDPVWRAILDRWRAGVSQKKTLLSSTPSVTTTTGQECAFATRTAPSW